MISRSVDESSPACHMTLLGGFDLVHEEQPLQPCGSGARLLAFLALHGRTRPVARASRPTAARPASARLRSVLWRLPRAGDRPLVTTTSTTTVQLAQFVQVDLWHAEDDARELAEDRSPAPRGLVTFQTDLLPDWPEDWLVIERESFRQTRLHALEQTSEQLCRNGSFAAALQAALSAVACEPLRETAHRRVIEVHLAEGNHGEALRQYQSYRRLLATQLGLPPTPAIRALVGPLLRRPADIGGKPADQPAKARPRAADTAPPRVT